MGERLGVCPTVYNKEAGDSTNASWKHVRTACPKAAPAFFCATPLKHSVKTGVACDKHSNRAVAKGQDLPHAPENRDLLLVGLGRSIIWANRLWSSLPPTCALVPNYCSL